jgi:hypothetical protein
MKIKALKCRLTGSTYAKTLVFIYRTRQFNTLIMDAVSYIQLGLLIVAVIAIVISFYQLRSHNAKENNKLLSELNERYVGNSNVQDVVKYLRKIDPENTEPTAYQVELFLRFFEELGVYLKTKSIKKKDVKEFFDFYFEQFETAPRGILLSEKINQDDKTWEYLNQYRKIMGYKVQSNN